MFNLNSHIIRLIEAFCLILVWAGLVGCGTSKLTNTTRTATEQLLISDAMDRAVSQANFSVLRGKHIYINTTPVEKITDAPYLQSLVRQHALSCGCLLETKEEDAEIIVELRAGTSGTDQNDTLFGLSEMTIPGFAGYSSVSIPEVAIAKRTIQRATVKIGIFAYTRETHMPIWQSGNLQAESQAKNRWLLGMGPYRTGDIYEKEAFAEQELLIPLSPNNEEEREFIPVGSQVFFKQNYDQENQDKIAREEKKKADAEKKAAEEAKAKEEAQAKKDGDSKKAEVAAAPAAKAAPAPPPLAPAPAPAVAQPATAVGSQVNLLNPPPAK